MPRILIVDDNELYCEALRDALIMDGFAVDVASSGLMAIESVQRSLPDAILLDLLLADGDGESLAAQLEAAGNQAPIILLSASVQAASAAKRMSAAGFLTKPFPVPKLIELVRHVSSADLGASALA